MTGAATQNRRGVRGKAQSRVVEVMEKGREKKGHEISTWRKYGQRKYFERNSVR